MLDVKIAQIPQLEIDPVTLDIIENALKNARFEMDAVLFRTAMSPVIREQHDEFPMITDPQGRMVVGQFGSYIAEMMRDYKRPVRSGDVIMTSDPYLCGGAISHVNDWLVLVPIFFDGELIGWSSMFGHQMDSGGPLAGSLPTGARTIYGEGIRIPPVKVFDQGKLQEDVVDLILNNVRQPEMNRADLLAIVAGCRTGEKRVVEICERFGKDVYLAACQALLDRTYKAMTQLILQNIPEEPQAFEDWIDDDGLGNGPFKMKLTIWREGDHAWFDWSGSDPQALGPINFYLNEGMFKMFIGVYLIMVFDPQILFNDGFYPLLHVVIPDGSLLHPHFPAALGCRTHALTRLFDVLGGALARKSPEYTTAAGYGTSPYMLYSGWDRHGSYYYVMEINYGGLPGRPVGDGIDGHSWWPLFENIPTEYLESYYPLRIERYTGIQDSGGAGFHRGGNGIEKVYVYLEPGEVSLHDDRWLTYPWGILGGTPGRRSQKMLLRTDGSQQVLPSKCDMVEVQPGDRIIYRTAGGGGWKDPFERPAAQVCDDVRKGVVSRQKAYDEYGVVLTETLNVDEDATTALRGQLREAREAAGGIKDFDFGPPLEEILARAREETGLEPPRPPQQLSWARLEHPETARARVRSQGDRQTARNQ